jgi:hypothetical protein
MKKEECVLLNKVKFALAVAIVISASLFLVTLLSMWGIMGRFPTLITIVAEIYSVVGYNTTFFGALLGAIGIFIDTFILSWIFAWLYNKLVS